MKKRISGFIFKFIGSKKFMSNKIYIAENTAAKIIVYFRDFFTALSPLQIISASVFYFCCSYIYFMLINFSLSRYCIFV